MKASFHESSFYSLSHLIVSLASFPLKNSIACNLNMESKKSDDAHVEDFTRPTFFQFNENPQNDLGKPSMTELAQRASEMEHSLSLWQGIKRYRKAVLWSIGFSLAIIMDGYDTAFTATLYAEPSFRRQFGQRYAGGYQITAGWQTLLGITGTVCNMIGVFLDGYVSEWIGRKWVTLASLIILSATIFCQFFAQSLPVLLVGRMMASVPIGVFQASTTTYAAEVCPVVLRGYLTTYVCLCWVSSRSQKLRIFGPDYHSLGHWPIYLFWRDRLGFWNDLRLGLQNHFRRAMGMASAYFRHFNMGTGM